MIITGQLHIKLGPTADTTGTIAVNYISECIRTVYICTLPRIYSGVHDCQFIPVKQVCFTNCLNEETYCDAVFSV